MSEIGHLKRLSGVKSASGIKFLTPAVSPGCHCPMRMAAISANKIKGLSSLLVGVPECTTHVRLYNPKPEGKDGELHWLYVLDSQEVVFGCREGILDAIREMYHAGAKAILLIITCVPELIGEDIEGILHEAQSEISVPATYVMLGQFKNFSYPSGYWKTMEAMGVLMTKRETDSLRINVVGRQPDEDHIPMPSLLPELSRRGFSLRYLAPGASLDDFQSAPDAALNLVVSPYVEPLAVRMKEDFGVPYLSLHTLFSVEDIDRVYNEVGEYCGFSWKGEFSDARLETMALEKQAKERLNGLRYVSSLGISMPLALATYLVELGMEPMLMHMEEFYPEDREHAKTLLGLGQNPPICRMVNVDAEYSIIEKLNPDICFGSLPLENMIIPNVKDMYRFYGKIGYEMTTELLKQILCVLDETDIARKGDVIYGTTSI